MLPLWLGFFALVALLLALDLGVLHRDVSTAPTLRSSIAWTVVWVALGLAFGIVIYLVYENHWYGADLVRCVGVPPDHVGDGVDAAATYTSAYLLEYALSLDNIFAIALVFTAFRVPLEHQHRVLFWGVIGAFAFRAVMLLGANELADAFNWIYYVFGGYLAWQGIKLLRSGDDGDHHPERSVAVRVLRRFVRIVDGESRGRFTVVVDGRRALTTVAVCLIVVELTDAVFAFDSVPAVVLVAPERFVMVTSNVFALFGLRSLYFVLAGAIREFRFLKVALAVLLVLIGAKMILAEAGVMKDSHAVTLIGIAGILGAGVLASVIATRREAAATAAAETATHAPQVTDALPNQD
jgi:tellurite resistance protein TerC